jgi:outer membrane protein TolC
VEAGIGEARAGHAPRIDFSEGFTRGNNPVYVFGSLLTQRQFTAADFALNKLNTPTPLDNFRTQFTASLSLFDAGQTRRRVREAKLGAQGAAQARQRTRQEVIFEVVNAYTNELLAKESVRVAEAAVEMSKADLARAQSRQEQGFAVPSDLLSARVHLAHAQQDLLQAQNAVALAHAALNVAMCVPEDSFPQLEEASWERLPLQAGPSLNANKGPSRSDRTTWKQAWAGSGPKTGRAWPAPNFSPR